MLRACPHVGRKRCCTARQGSLQRDLLGQAGGVYGRGACSVTCWGKQGAARRRRVASRGGEDRGSYNGE